MKFDYNKKYKQNNIKQEEEIKQPIIEEPVIEEIKNEEKDEHKTDGIISEHINEEKYGIVANCDLLNVRKEPNLNSEIVAIISKDQKVKIIEELEEFYKVLLINENISINAYCMKKYIKII